MGFNSGFKGLTMLLRENRNSTTCDGVLFSRSVEWLRKERMLCGFVYVNVCISLHDFYLFSVSLSFSPVWKYLFVCREVRMIAY